MDILEREEMAGACIQKTVSIPFTDTPTYQSQAVTFLYSDAAAHAA